MREEFDLQIPTFTEIINNMKYIKKLVLSTITLFTLGFLIYLVYIFFIVNTIDIDDHSFPA